LPLLVVASATVISLLSLSFTFSHLFICVMSAGTPGIGLVT
jgi:hypothetical protein